MAKKTSSLDDRYFELFARPVRACARYKPRFGTGNLAGLTVQEFQELYASDAFYNWIGLDSPLMYAAHKAAGGMTSIYRQIGIGCQWIFRQVLIDQLRLTEEQVSWSYDVPVPGGKARRLTLDGRIEFNDVANKAQRKTLEAWIASAQDRLLLDRSARRGVRGVVFEVRQGYKSMDSKRQNADISNASSAYAHHYVPALVLMSGQIDQVLVQRYSQSFWLLLKGTRSGSPLDSTYSFCRDVLGYDLAEFFQRNSKRFKHEFESVLSTLLKP